MGFDAHWIEDHGEAVYPRGILPACVGEQEVESACGGEIVRMVGFEHHDVLIGMAKGVPLFGCGMGRIWDSSGS